MEFGLGLADHFFGMIEIEAFFTVKLNEAKGDVGGAELVIELEVHIHRLNEGDTRRGVAIGGLECARSRLEIIFVEGTHSLIVSRSGPSSILIADLRSGDGRGKKGE